MEEADDKYNPDGWTFSTLYTHVMEISKAAKEGVSAAMAASEKAVLKAETANEKRFDSVNEFRQQLKDQQDTFAVKSETNLRFEGVEKRLDLLTNREERSSGKNSGMMIALIGLAWIITTAIALAAIFLRH